MLEYYRHYMPVLVGQSEAQYATTTEAKRADDALDAYRQETGALDAYANLPL